MKEFAAFLLLIVSGSVFGQQPFVKCDSASREIAYELNLSRQHTECWNVKELCAACSKTDSLAAIVVSELQNYPAAHFILSTHTDLRGSESFNLRLSQKQAKEITQLLIRHGIPREQLQINAKGESEPLIPETIIREYKKDIAFFESLHQQNRRIELIVILPE